MKFVRQIPFANEVYNIFFRIGRYFEIRNDWNKFTSMCSSPRFLLEKKDRKFFYSDATGSTTFEPHYLYHPAWAARILAQTRPEIHVDISSSLHFCTLVSAFIPVKFYDFRPAEINLSNLTSGHADLTSLPFPDNSIASLSCMHTVEHIGLGRYGDPVDPDGDLKAIAELKRVMAPGGDLLFVVPVGKDARIIFNAHRIYTNTQIRTYFNDFELADFSLITDNPKLDVFIEHADPALSKQCTYGCGCFLFRKK